MYRIGLDVGSTTAKIVVLDEDKVIYSSYRRHQANPGAVIKDILVELKVVFGKIKLKEKL